MINPIVYTTERTMDNVSEEFKGMIPSEVKCIIDPKRSQLVNVCMNHTNDFNKASIIRTNNSFLAKELILVGKKRFNRKGTTGLHHLENLKHAEDIQDAIEYLHENDYKIYAISNNENYDPQVAYDVDLPEKTAFIYEEEAHPFTDDILEMCDGLLYIPQRNIPRSLNAAQLAAAFMSEYNRQHKLY